MRGHFRPPAGRAISGETHSGLADLRSALPMNIKAKYPGFRVWAGAQADIERVTAIWRECLAGDRGACPFADRPRMADAMHAPVGARFVTCDVTLGPGCAACCRTIITMPPMTEWIADAQAEPEERGVLTKRNNFVTFGAIEDIFEGFLDKG